MLYAQFDNGGIQLGEFGAVLTWVTSIAIPSQNALHGARCLKVTFGKQAG